MICPKCGCTTKVIDSRSADTGQSTRRRHECIRCRWRFTTYEITEKKLAEYERTERTNTKLMGKIEELKKIGRA